MLLPRRKLDYASMAFLSLPLLLLVSLPAVSGKSLQRCCPFGAAESSARLSRFEVVARHMPLLGNRSRNNAERRRVGRSAAFNWRSASPLNISSLKSRWKLFEVTASQDYRTISAHRAIGIPRLIFGNGLLAFNYYLFRKYWPFRCLCVPVRYPVLRHRSKFFSVFFFMIHPVNQWFHVGITVAWFSSEFG